MSSTNRGADRNIRDYYGTPAHAYQLLDPLLPRDVCFWEPACGDGRIITWLRSTGRSADGGDIEPQHVEFSAINFLHDETRREFIITNPPFSAGIEFVDHAVQVSPEVLMLLPLNFAGSKRRHHWFRAHPPAAQFILSERPDFTGAGGDSIDYAWWYWGPRYTGMHWPSPAKSWKPAKHPGFLLWPDPASLITEAAPSVSAALFESGGIKTATPQCTAPK